MSKSLYLGEVKAVDLGVEAGKELIAELEFEHDDVRHLKRDAPHTVRDAPHTVRDESDVGDLKAESDGAADTTLGRKGCPKHQTPCAKHGRGCVGGLALRNAGKSKPKSKIPEFRGAASINIGSQAPISVH